MPETKTVSRLVIIILIVALLAYTVWFVTRPEPIEVELATIARGPVESTVVNTSAGSIKACRRARLAPAAGGQIVKLQVREGERVTQGQVLLEIWNSVLSAQHELAQRQLITAREKQREACIIADQANRQSKRIQQLVDKNFVSQQRSADADAVGLDVPNGFDSGFMSIDDRFKHTFDEVGLYDYYCQLHPWMIGSVTVE